MVARRNVLSGAVLALTLALVGCDAPGTEVSSADIEGTWVAHGPKGETSQLVFLADGTYSGKNLPDRIFYVDNENPKYGGPPDWSSPDAISGKWKTEWNAEVKHASVVVSIKGRIAATAFSVEEEPKGRKVVWYIGDPDADLKVSFAKEN